MKLVGSRIMGLCPIGASAFHDPSQLCAGAMVVCQAHDSSWTCLSPSGESHITRDFVPDCSQGTDQDMSPSGGYGRCLNTTHTSAYRPAASGHTTVALETRMYQEHGWAISSLQWWALYQKSYFQCTDCLTLSLISSCPLNSGRLLGRWRQLSPERDQDKSGGGLMVLDRPVLKIQDSLLPALGDDALFFPLPVWRAEPSESLGDSDLILIWLHLHFMKMPLPHLHLTLWIEGLNGNRRSFGKEMKLQPPEQYTQILWQ